MKPRNNPSRAKLEKIKEVHRIEQDRMYDSIYYTKNINEPAEYRNCSEYPFKFSFYNLFSSSRKFFRKFKDINESFENLRIFFKRF